MSGVVLGTRDQRTLAFGAAVILTLIVGFRGVPAWLAWRANARADASEAMSQAARGDALLAGLSQSLDTLEARTATVAALGPALLVGETPAEAASALAALVGDLARRSLVRLDAMDMRVDTSGAHVLPRLSVDVQGTADITGLSAFVYALEQGPALLAIQRLAVRPQNVDGAADQIETLSIRLTVQGVALIRPAGNAR